MMHPHRSSSHANARRAATERTNERTTTVVMSNPVCYFDVEIGGQPAGRIEMTVRRRRSKDSCVDNAMRDDGRARDDGRERETGD